MQLLLPDSTCSTCGASMDIYGDHALLCRGDPHFSNLQLRHHLMQQSLGIILHLAGICHAEEPPYLHLRRDDSPKSEGKPKNVPLKGHPNVRTVVRAYAREELLSLGSRGSIACSIVGRAQAASLQPSRACETPTKSMQ